MHEKKGLGKIRESFAKIHVIERKEVNEIDGGSGPRKKG
jgi:hypothetical protein